MNPKNVDRVGKAIKYLAGAVLAGAAGLFLPTWFSGLKNKNGNKS